MTMSDRDALLQAICETPDDDAPRLVYADWLEEHGDPRQAELIRVQIELARGPEKVREAKPLTSKLSELWEYFDQWQFAIGDWRQQALHNYDRGFPKEWKGTTESFLSRCEHWWRFGPITELTLDFDTAGKSSSEDADRVARCPILGNVREIHLSGRRLTDEWVKAFLGSPFSSRWKAVSLRSKQLTDRLCQPIAKSVLSGTNCHLRIYSSQISPEGRSVLEQAFAGRLLIY
jgi:uncharacterized protein (TIGR02996 family)